VKEFHTTKEMYAKKKFARAARRHVWHMDGGTERHNQKDGYEAGIACKVVEFSPVFCDGAFFVH